MERRFLQAVVVLFSAVPIVGGIAGILHGPWLFGAYRYNDDTISQIAYLSGLLLGLALVILATVPSIEKHSARYLVAGFIVFVGGLARLYVGLLTGFGTLPHQVAIVLELGVTPAIVAWQVSYAKRYSILND